MTTPDDPTNPGGTPGGDPTEDQLRAALGARAASVLPGEPDAGALGAAIAADSRNRLRRNRVLMGVAAAAVLIIAVAIAGIVDDGDRDRIITGSDVETTIAPATTTEPGPGETTETTLAPTTTTQTTAAPTTSSTAAPTTTTTAAPPVLPGATVDPKSGSRQGDVMAFMTDLRVGCNAGFDRVVLEFQDGALPEWSVGYVAPPITMDGSGETVQVAGSAYLQIRLDGASGHDMDTAAPTYHGPSRVSSGCPEVADVVNAGEFEAIYNWIVGVGHEAPFTVSTLTGPSRLVIDIAHTS